MGILHKKTNKITDHREKNHEKFIFGNLLSVNLFTQFEG